MGQALFRFRASNNEQGAAPAFTHLHSPVGEPETDKSEYNVKSC